MKRRTLFAASGAAAMLVLAGCKDNQAPASSSSSSSSSGGSAPAAGSTPVSIEAITVEGQGFNLGSTMAARTAYVFFDPQCPHCAALWQAAKPLRNQARFVWMPVGLLNAKSTDQGAALLAAADPVALMDQHESTLRASGGIAGGGAEAQRQAVKRNTELMTRFGFASVPTVVGKHAQSGELVTIEGSVPTQVLAQKLGLQAS